MYFIMLEGPLCVLLQLNFLHQIASAVLCRRQMVEMYLNLIYVYLVTLLKA